MPRITSAAVIGAGIAGLACAGGLRAAGIAVSLFDKGRRPGGRIATRRWEGGAFNHGAQYATARAAGFQAVIGALADAGAAAHWDVVPREGPAAARDAAWVGVPGMSALPRRLAAALASGGADLRLARHVGHLHAEARGWAVRHFPAATMRPGAVAAEAGEVAAGFDAVLLAIPAPQAAGLLGAIGHGYAASLGGVAFAPCWAVMAAFGSRLDRPDILRMPAGPIGWAAREGSRPGCPAAPEAWTLHASAAWSRAHLEREGAEVAADLLAALAPDAPAPLHLAAHRWRHALVETALGQDCLWDPAASLGVCGDFCRGPRVEAAWQSGTALASAVLSHN